MKKLHVHKTLIHKNSNIIRIQVDIIVKNKINSILIEVGHLNIFLSSLNG